MDRRLRRYFPVIPHLPAMEDRRPAQSRRSPPEGAGNPGHIFAPVQQHADPVYAGTGRVRRTGNGHRHCLRRCKRLFRTFFLPQGRCDRQIRIDGFSRVAVPIHADHRHRPEGKAEHHLPVLPQTGGYLLRSRHLPLIPKGLGRHFLHRQHGPAQRPEKGGFGEPETRIGAQRGQHHPLEMGSYEPHYPVRPQQGGQDGRRNVAGKQRLACGGRGVLLLESPQGRPGTRPRSLQEPDRRAYGEGLRRVPRRIQRERALAHGVGRGTGHGRNPRLRWQAAVAGRDIARDLRTQTDGAGAAHRTRPCRRVEPPEIGIPGQHEPRDTHAAQCHRRVFGHPCLDGRRAGKAGIHVDHRKQQYVVAATHQRYPRPFEDRGRDARIRPYGFRTEQADARERERHEAENRPKRGAGIRTAV